MNVSRGRKSEPESDISYCSLLVRLSKKYFGLRACAMSLIPRILTIGELLDPATFCSSNLGRMLSDIPVWRMLSDIPVWRMLFLHAIPQPFHSSVFTHNSTTRHRIWNEVDNHTAL